LWDSRRAGWRVASDLSSPLPAPDARQKQWVSIGCGLDHFGLWRRYVEEWRWGIGVGSLRTPSLMGLGERYCSDTFEAIAILRFACEVELRVLDWGVRCRISRTRKADCCWRGGEEQTSVCELLDGMSAADVEGSKRLVNPTLLTEKGKAAPQAVVLSLYQRHWYGWCLFVCLERRRRSLSSRPNSHVRAVHRSS
jgi:hypothetical protein